MITIMIMIMFMFVIITSIRSPVPRKAGLDKLLFQLLCMFDLCGNRDPQEIDAWMALSLTLRRHTTWLPHGDDLV